MKPNRTIADVIAEWRASPVNNDDGELASRINWFISGPVDSPSKNYCPVCKVTHPLTVEQWNEAQAKRGQP